MVEHVTGHAAGPIRSRLTRQVCSRFLLGGLSEPRGLVGHEAFRQSAVPSAADLRGSDADGWPDGLVGGVQPQAHPIFDADVTVQGLESRLGLPEGDAR